MKRFDLNRSGALEREELFDLLSHLHPEHPPNGKALDLLIEKATEVRTYSMLVRGDSNGRVYPEKLFKVVGTYAAYVLADSAFARLDHGTGVLRLKDLPALMSEARAGAEARDDEVSFVLGSVAHTRNGDMLTDDDVSDAVSIDLSTRGGELTRAELLPALARIQLDDRDVGTAPGTVEELSDGDDSDEADGPELPNDCWTAAAPGEGAAPGVASGDSLPGKTQNGSRRKGTPPTGGICTLQ